MEHPLLRIRTPAEDALGRRERELVEKARLRLVRRREQEHLERARWRLAAHEGERGKEVFVRGQKCGEVLAGVGFSA